MAESRRPSKKLAERLDPYIQVAKEFGMLPSEYIATTHNREHQMLWAWLQLEWNKPSRSDHYLMQIACEVRRVLADNKSKITLKDFIIEFTRSIIKPKTEKQINEETKSRWFSFLGYKGKKDGDN